MPSTLSPQDFAAKWRRATIKERSAAQEHFIDLCRMLGQPTPAEGDPTGQTYRFEAGANKVPGKAGWTDVWKQGCFAWEYKGKHADLNKAYQQLQQYRESLNNPPLLIVSDLERIVIHTNFTNTVKRTFEITLDDVANNTWVNPLPDFQGRDRRLAGEGLARTTPLAMLRAVFEAPESFKARETTAQVTQEAAENFAKIAGILGKWNNDPHAVAHFLIRLLFCLFAEDIDLLPKNLFQRILDSSLFKPGPLAQKLRQLFAAMRDGGAFGVDDIKHFNGGLFDDDRVIELEGESMNILRNVSALDWSSIEPSIFGTLFERSLDPAKRAQLGAHYTSREDILLIVEPVLMAPLRRTWAEVQARARKLAAQRDAATGKPRNKLYDELNTTVMSFANELAKVRVLDAACGSGNFLYVALRQLLDLEKEVITLCDEAGLPRFAPRVSPAQLFGIEIDDYAHELAQATVWIGYIQWRNENGFGFPDEPILRKLDNIKQMDAILHLPSPSGGGAGGGGMTEPEWPEADVIIGNPPFLGDKKMRAELGDEYVDALRKLYKDRIPGQSDLCCYWFEKARTMIEQGKAKRAGLIATNSIRKGVNRSVLERITESGGIFMGWSDRAWILDGAAVRVSIVGFDDGTDSEHSLDGKSVAAVNSDLTSAVDVTQVCQLEENGNLAFLGMMKAGPFDIDAKTAQRMLVSQLNPKGAGTRSPTSTTSVRPGSTWRTRSLTARCWMRMAGRTI
jgi:type II restriction/modification system DNA methylase subunit YeeA